MRKLLRTLHRWSGLVLALPLMLQGVTGFILALDPLILGDEAPLWAGEPASSDPATQIPAIVAAAQREAPAGLVPRRYRVGEGGAAVVSFAEPGAQQPSVEVVVELASNQVRAVREPTGGFDRWVHRLHETLLLGLEGRSVVGWFGIGLMVVGLSGIPLWWPEPGRWRAAMLVSPQSRGTLFLRELHGAAGFWVVGLLLFQSISGAALAFPQTARALAGMNVPARQAPSGGRAPAPIDAAPMLGPAITAAMQAVPDADVRELRLPPVRGRPIMTFLSPHGQWPGAPAATVAFDPSGGRVLSTEDPRTQAVGPWLLGWLRSLHYGAGLGLGWRLVIVMSGLCLPLFPVTGVLMWLRRRRNRRRMATQRAAAVMDAGQ